MANYVTYATVSAKLPSSLPASMNEARVTALLVEASNEVDELVGANFSRAYNSSAQKFPQITDTPGPPATIQLCALWLTLARVYEEIADIANNMSDEDNDAPNKIYYRGLAEKKLDAVRDGKIDLSIEPTGQVAAQDKYFDSATENGMDHKHKFSEMDVYLP